MQQIQNQDLQTIFVVIKMNQNGFMIYQSIKNIKEIDEVGNHKQGY